MRSAFFRNLSVFKRQKWIIAGCVAVMVLVAAVELSMGRLAFGPDGVFGWWEGNIWSQENSQRLLDPYSFSHFLHGVLFYAGLWVCARGWPVPVRLLAAMCIEGIWEMLENSPIIIDRYREVTISLGYVGDSVVNSAGDMLMVPLGFLFARLVPVWVCVATLLAIEAGCAWFMHDNLLLNMIMLAFPMDAIREWQMSIAPPAL